VVAASVFWLIVPLRPRLFNHSAGATLILLGTLTGAAFILGIAGPWKSMWCTSFCPVYPVEKFYGATPLWPAADARCIPNQMRPECYRCTIHCLDIADSDQRYWRSMDKLRTPAAVDRVHRFFVGSFPGVVLGYWIAVEWNSLSLGETYLCFAGCMIACYALHRAIETTMRNWRIDLLTPALALNLFYASQSRGLAALLAGLDGSPGSARPIRLGIIGIVILLTSVWFYLARRGSPPRWVRW
jgi:hypothetical protein